MGQQSNAAECLRCSSCKCFFLDSTSMAHGAATWFHAMTSYAQTNTKQILIPHHRTSVEDSILNLPSSKPEDICVFQSNSWYFYTCLDSATRSRQTTFLDDVKDCQQCPHWWPVFNSGAVGCNMHEKGRKSKENLHLGS